MTEYESLRELKEQEPSSAWRQSACNRWSWLTVVAPHGGTIEPFTERLAYMIAGDEYNFFVFEGRRRKNDYSPWLHVRSELYADSELDTLLMRCDVALSVHGARDPETGVRVTFLGGLNTVLRDHIWNALDAQGFKVQQGTERYAGEHPDNLVNRPKEFGVQFEISRSERDALRDNPERCRRYVDAIRLAIRLHEHSTSPSPAYY